MLTADDFKSAFGNHPAGVAVITATSGIDRVSDTSIWSRLITGEPFLPSANARMRGRTVNRMQAGDSTEVAVQVLQVDLPCENGRTAQQAPPLVYHNRTWHSLSESSVVV